MSEPILDAYHHDAHKLLGESHTSASTTFAGATVNRSVPYGADRDAAVLSRPAGEPETTVEAYTTPQRLWLCTGTIPSDPAQLNVDGALRELLTEPDVERAR